jgi:hypothetical protein
MRKRKKGKLPKDATSALKAWWQGNLVWPYPSVRAPSHPLPTRFPPPFATPPHPHQR